MAISKASNVYRDAYTHLESIKNSLLESEESSQQIQSAARKFIQLDIDLPGSEGEKVDDAIRTKIITLIRDLKDTPELKQALGAIQAQFYQTLQKIESHITHSKAKTVQKVELDRLEA